MCLSRYTFTIDFSNQKKAHFPSLNEYIGSSHNSYARSAMKHKYDDIVSACALEQGIPKMEKPIRIHMNWFEPNRRRDLDNIRFGVKFIQDGLVHAGILSNDNQKFVVGLSDSFLIDKQHPRVEVTLTEIDND